MAQRGSRERSSNDREARGDAMFPLPALITREPRPAERSVARRPGIVFTISGRFSIYAAVVHEPKAAGLEWAFKQPEECWNASPPLSSSGMKFAGNLVFSSLKAVKAV